MWLEFIIIFALFVFCILCFYKHTKIVNSRKIGIEEKKWRGKRNS